MNCNEFDEILAGLFDGPRDPQWARAAAHAAQCARCHEQFQSLLHTWLPNDARPDGSRPAA